MHMCMRRRVRRAGRGEIRGCKRKTKRGGDTCSGSKVAYCRTSEYMIPKNPRQESPVLFVGAHRRVGARVLHHFNVVKNQTALTPGRYSSRHTCLTACVQVRTCTHRFWSRRQLQLSGVPGATPCMQLNYFFLCRSLMPKKQCGAREVVTAASLFFSTSHQETLTCRQGHFLPVTDYADTSLADHPM